MSPQIEALALRLKDEDFARDQERFDWLQERLSEITINYAHPVDPMQEMLSCYARQVARESGTDLATGWITAAQTLRGSLPDPDDQLFGLFIASEAWALELRYGLDDMARFLRRMRVIGSVAEDTGDEAQDAYQLYEHLINRMQDVDAMLDRELGDGKTVPTAWTNDPDMIANALTLIDKVVAARIRHVEDVEGREVELEEIDAITEQGGYYLRACFRAKEHGIGFEELATYVLRFPNAWAELLEDIVRESALAPGVLSALAEARSEESRASLFAAELIATHRGMHPEPCTLTEYLTRCLSAVEQNA